MGYFCYTHEMRLLDKLKQETTNVSLKLAALTGKKQTVVNDVGFVSQFTNPKWAEKILKDGEPKTSDPDWQQSGAESAEEYEKWVTTICGMACTAMALEYFGKGKHQTITMAKDALHHGVYQEHSGELSDMRYKEYVDWVSNFGISATLYSRLTISGIKHILSKGGLVIVSVNPNIRGYETAPKKQKGGHLVLVKGYNETDNTITIHNPSGFVSQNTHTNHTLTIDIFRMYFADRGISLYSK